jgi:hypothetical protein
MKYKKNMGQKKLLTLFLKELNKLLKSTKINNKKKMIKINKWVELKYDGP